MIAMSMLSTYDEYTAAIASPARPSTLPPRTWCAAR